MFRFSINRSLLIPLLCLIVPLASLAQTNPGAAPSPPAPVTEKSEHKAQRMAWWRDARFGMFIHWDMSSVEGREISWSRGGSRPLDVPVNPAGHTDFKAGRKDPAGYVEDPGYDHLYQQFNPTNFDANAWVKLAQDSGAKYIVFTSKHHGGFCMWDTKLTDYNLMNSPFKRDVVKELAEACHKAGMRFGIYYSPRDWHHPDYGMGDNRKYADYMNGQMRELLTKYGPVDLLWFDSYGRGDLINFWHEDETWNLIKSLTPNILINNRLCNLADYNQQPPPYRGDFGTPEGRIGSFDTNTAWESCITLQKNGWSYHRNEPVLSLEECVRTLVLTATGDGNLLLDVGPNELGEIPSNQSDRFLQIGEWLKKYGFTIYGTRGGPFKCDASWGGTTHKGNKIFIHALGWPPSGILHLPGLKGKVTASRVVTDKSTPVKVTSSDNGTDLTLDPRTTVNQIDTIVELTMESPIGI